MDRKYLGPHSNNKYRRILKIIRSRFYLNTNNDPRNTFMVAGTGRSGTTWLADIITSQIPCRLIFEPFNLRKAFGAERFHLFQYMHPGQHDDELLAYAHKVMTGKVRSSWIDFSNNRFLAQFRLIKEIRANLLLKWLHDEFPQVPMLFILRHPCAVVLSRRELGWATDTDIEPFLHQENLIQDHLSNKMDLIKRAHTEVEKHAIVWCVSNLVPLSQLVPGDFTVIFYEYLCTQPEMELPKVFATIRHEHRNLNAGQLQKPSITSTIASAIMTGENKISRWKDHLRASEIDSILRIIQDFGLDYLYTDASLPVGTALVLQPGGVKSEK